MLVKILSCSALLSVGSCYVLCMLAMYVFTVSSCVWVCNGVEALKGPHSLCPLEISTPLRTRSWIQWTHILPTYIINSRSQQILMCFN